MKPIQELLRLLLRPDVSELALGTILFLFARDLNLMSLGEETAYSLGVSPEQAKLLVLGAAALATARTPIGVHPVREPLKVALRRLRTDPPVAVWPVTSRGH